MPSQTIKTALNLLLTALIAAFPLVQNTQLSDPTLLPRQFWTVGIAMLLGLILAIQPQRARQSIAPQLLIAVFTLVLLSLAGTFYAFNLPEALASSARLITMLTSLLLLLWVLHQNLVPKSYFLWGVTLSAVIGLILLTIEISGLQKGGIALWENKNLYQLRSAFGHKNLYSSYQLCCLPFVMLLFLESRLFSRILLGALIVSIVVSLLLVQTKAVLLALFLSIGILFSYASFTGTVGSTRTKKIMAGLCLLAILMGITILKLFPAKVNLLLSNDTVVERYLLWGNSLKMFKAHFWWGVGPGNWQIFFPKYGLGEFMQTNYLISDGFTTFQRPHNDFLWVACELGMVGLIAYLFIFIYALKEAFVQRKSAIQYWIMLGAILSYMVVAAVDFPLERSEHQFLFALMLAFVIRPSTSEKASRWWVAIPIIAGLVFVLGFGLNRFAAEKSCKQLILSYQSGQYVKMQSNAQDIDQTYLSIDNYSIPIYWYQGLALYAMGRKDLALLANQKAYAVNPYQIHVINNLAGLYHENDSLEKALGLYQEILAISPTQPDALLNVSAVYYNLGQTNEAFKTLYQFKYDKDNIQFQESLKRIGQAYFKEVKQIDLSVTELNNWFLKSKEKGLTFEASINQIP